MIGRLSNDSGVLAPAVEVTIARDHRRLDQQEGWRGEAWISTETHVLPGDTLTLELKDGMAVPIIVDRVTVDSKAGQMLIRFTGKGRIDGVGGSEAP